MTRHRPALVLLVCGVACIAACQPRPGIATPTPAVVSTTPTLNYLAPGVAAPKLHELADAAGSTTLLQAKISADDISLAVLDTKGSAATWSFRNGSPTKVDGDLAYVGQAAFTLSDFNLTDLSDICAQAGVLSGSTTDQEVQIVEYSGGQAYLTVTTQPESTTIFFRPDATLVPILNYSDPGPDAFATALDSITTSEQNVTAIGYEPALGLYAEKPGTTGTVRIVRPARFPARTEQHAAKPTTTDFDPRLVPAATLAKLVARFGQQGKFTLVIDRREGMREPLIHIQADGKQLITDLAGNDVTRSVGTTR
ncbi:MAG: hypothetical protein ACRCWS_03980 [Propionibacteriaceae bacterium]